ncbi:lipoprotein [Methylomonas sp. SURF-2]|uniref:Lipoprotein n=1 Tax=Methylomonas subterranea TaxID=2952225 RepID=A0ABT1TJG8_9GAMM|nr:lipoprotein [Methylomonas sp. SURF-2]MCQ8105622.1 lipoprotein [Methylomonas sp. SURF-2]
MKVNALFFLVLLGLLAQACGQTGPLYLPDSPPPVYVPKTSPAEEQ